MSKHFFCEYRNDGGPLDSLAREIGTSDTYVSAEINGSRTASLGLQNQIANFLYGPFDKFIAAGRRIKMGLHPKKTHEVTQGSIENLIAELTHSLEDKLTDPTAFLKSVEKINNSAAKNVHSFDLKDGRTIRKNVYPMFRGDALSGRIALFEDVTEIQK